MPLKSPTRGSKKPKSDAKKKPATSRNDGNGARANGATPVVTGRKPPRIPVSLQELDLGERKKLVDMLAPSPEPTPSTEVAETLRALEPPVRRFHGTKVPLHWLPRRLVESPAADKFGYMFSAVVRKATKLPFNATTQALLTQLGNLMGDAGRDAGADSTIPAGYTYFGQFVDHDITLDVSSTIDAPQDATTINNMRSPVLHLDSVYGRGPALDPFLYHF